MSKLPTNNISTSQTYFNYLSAIISLTILLFLFGLWGALALYTGQFINQSKEKIPFYIELKDEVNEASVFAFQKKLEATSYVLTKSVSYISKDDALHFLKDDEVLTKEDVLLFGENLLPNMIRFSINNANFANYEQIVKEIESQPFVDKVFYTSAPAKNLSTKVYHAELILIVLLVFFIFVVITLIKNTVKLLLLSNKEVILTMQTVGATFEYMAKPYLRQSFKNGVVSALIAIVALAAIYMVFEEDLMQLQIKVKSAIYGLLGVVLLLGVLISWGATRHSVGKYLNKPVEDWQL